MNKTDIDLLFKFLEASYPKHEFKEDFYDYWSLELTQYSCEDVKAKLRLLMEDEKYYNRPPQLEVILKGLPKIREKIDYKKVKTYCKFCRKPLIDIEEAHEHEDRCRSINYIESKYKEYGWNFDKSTKAKMYKMSDEEFDEKYNSFLKKIESLTTNEYEKKLINFIFNPPGLEEAKKFLESD